MNQELKSTLCTEPQAERDLLTRIYEVVGSIIKSPSFSKLCDFLSQKEENPPKIMEIPSRDMVAESCGFIPDGFDTLSSQNFVLLLRSALCPSSSEYYSPIVVLRGNTYFVHIENPIKFLSEVKGYKLVSYNARKFIESRKNT
jgi:hypothetical protein